MFFKYYIIPNLFSGFERIMTESYDTYTVVHFKNKPYVAYELLKSCSWVTVITFALYTMLILSPFFIVNIAIFIVGTLASLVVISSVMNRYKTKISNDAIKNEFSGLLIGQFITIFFNIYIAIFLLINHLGVVRQYSSLAVTVIVVFFEIAYYVRYLIIGLSFYSISNIHKKMTGNFSYANRIIFTGFFVYPIIFLKFVLFNSDAQLINRYIFGGIFLTNRTFASMILVIVIIHIVLAAVYVAYIVETSIKFHLVSKKMIEKSDE